MLGTLILLSAIDSLSNELFLVTSLIGLLIVIELTAPVNVTPVCRARLKWPIAVGLVVFAAIVIRRVLEIVLSNHFIYQMTS